MAHLKIERLSRLLDLLSKEPFYHRILSRLIVYLNRDGRILSPRIYHGWEWERRLPSFEQYRDDLIAQLVDFSFSACWLGTNSYQFRPRISFAGSKTKQELAFILGGFIKNVFGDLLQHAGKQVFVESSTWNILFAREILELVPDAKILHVYRDPRDVVASFCDQRWTPHDKEQGARWYTALMERWFVVRSHLPRDCFFELKLERFLDSPETVLGNMCGFIGVPYDERMLDLDLSRSHTGRWLTEYSDEEKEIVLPILANVMRELGYK
jgi:hypothetical protein